MCMLFFFQAGWFNLHLDSFISWNNHVFFPLCFDSWNRNSSTLFLFSRVKPCFGFASQQHSPFSFFGFQKNRVWQHLRIPHHQWRPPSCRLSLQAEVQGNWESHRAGEDEQKNPGAQWQVTFVFLLCSGCFLKVFFFLKGISWIWEVLEFWNLLWMLWMVSFNCHFAVGDGLACSPSSQFPPNINGACYCNKDYRIQQIPELIVLNPCLVIKLWEIQDF